MVTRLLIDAALGKSKKLGETNLDKLLKAAAKNKILLHILRVLGIKGEIRAQQEKLFEVFLKNLEEVLNALDGLNYSFYKLVKPVTYVPADIDVLIGGDDVNKAVYSLSKAGYRIVVHEPLVVTMVKRESIIDLYVHPNMGGMIYLDGSKLLTHTTTINFHGILVPSLPSYAEALVTAAHAIYKEMLYTLNDYITIRTWSNEETFKLAEELKCKPLFKYIQKLSSFIERNIIELPYKVPLVMWIRLWAPKIISDPLTRFTTKYAFKTLMSKQSFKRFRLKLTRESY